MRYIKYAFLAAIAVVLICVALANLNVVTLQLLPADVAELLGFQWQIELPLFLVIFIGIVVGLMIGFVWEWLREYKHRSEAARRREEARRLEKELNRTKAQRDQGKDEVLTILDDPNRSRA